MNVSGMDVTNSLSESAKREIARAVVGAIGDRAVQSEYRFAALDQWHSERARGPQAANVVPL